MAASRCCMAFANLCQKGDELFCVCVLVLAFRRSLSRKPLGILRYVAGTAHFDSNGTANYI